MLRNLDRIVGTILGGRDLAGLFEDPTEVCRIAVATAAGNFLQGHAVVLQHELRPVHPNQIQIVIETHEPLPAEEAGDVVRSQAKMPRDAFPRERTVEVLLQVQTDGFVRANRLTGMLFLRRLQEPQAGVQQGFSQKTRQRSVGVVGGQNHKCRQNTVGRHVVAALYAGFDRCGRHLRTTLMPNQTDTDLLHAKEKGQNIHVPRPVRFVPRMVRHKNSMSADWLDRFRASAMSHLHGVTSRERERKTGKICYIGEWRRGRGPVAKMYATNSRLSQILLEFMHDQSRTRGQSRARMRGIEAHGTLR